MIGPELEQAQNGAGASFFDSVSIDFCDGAHDVFGLLRVVRLPGEGCTRAVALVFAGGELVTQQSVEAPVSLDDWREIQIDGVSATTEVPLERWRAALSASGAGFELEAQAASLPVDLNEAEDGAEQSDGLHRYEQLCELRGRVNLRGRDLPLHCAGRRQHAWGVFDWKRLDRRRSLYAAAESRGVTVASTRPTASQGHGDERCGAYLLTPDDGPLAFEEVRISTVFGRDRLPRKAGLELFSAGDDYPQRVSGEALYGTPVSLGQDYSHAISFFRWSWNGEAALGAYETLERR